MTLNIEPLMYQDKRVQQGHYVSVDNKRGFGVFPMLTGSEWYVCEGSKGNANLATFQDCIEWIVERLAREDAS